jgi:7-carboxy-7-deazaguanine synthase
MEQQMCMANLKQVQKADVYKFVIASEEDLNRAVELVNEYDLQNRCQVFFSPVRELIDPLVIVDKMKEHCLNGVRLQLQLHKILWPKEMRGV